jgi:glycosyltransferase involved in cell wall biosynthesis
MKVVHIAEAFEGGVIEFLRCLTHSTPDFSYTIIYGRPQFFEKAHKTFPLNTEFIFWPHAGREISPTKDVKALRELIKILKTQTPFDIIHLHSSKAGILGRLAARAVKHKNVIYAPHGAAFLRKDISFLTRSVYITIEKAATIFPAKIVGVSKSEADTYRRIGIKADYVNNGKFFPPSAEKSNHKHEFTIVTTGRIVNQKHPAWFNEIAGAFINNHDVKFKWIGDGAEKKLLTSPNISVTGWVDKSEVENLLLNADLYLSTALWEGLPYAVLEAMSMRLPLLLSNCAGNRDLVEQDINGFLYNDPNEAIQCIKKYLNNKELIQLQGEASFAMLQAAFNIEQMAEGYRRIYASMV